MIHPTDSNEHDVPLKRCTKCEQEKPATTQFFYSKGKGSTQLRADCRACISAYRQRPEVKESRQAYGAAYYRKNPEKWRTSARNHYQSPERHERALAYQREYRNRNHAAVRKQQIDAYYARIRTPEGLQRTRMMNPSARERKRVRDRLYYKSAEFRERRHAYQRVYRSRPEIRQRSRERSRINDHSRRSLKRAVGGTHTSAQIQDLLRRQRQRCYYCSVKFARKDGTYVYHIEHTFPLSRASGSDPINDISYLVLACPTCNMKKGNKYPWEFPEGGKLL